nr:MAG TPA: hypothetical protein [Caudoviricetes sp.]
MFKETSKLDSWIDTIDSFIELEDGNAVASDVISNAKDFIKSVYDLDKTNPWHRRCGVTILSSAIGSILISIQAVNGTQLDIEFLPMDMISMYHYDTLSEENNVVDLLYLDAMSVEEAIDEFKKLLDASAI